MAWYNTVGKDADTVISSRVRLARNINGYPFASRLDAAGANELIEKVSAPLEQAGFRKINFADISPVMATSYVERHYVSPEFATKESPRALLLQEQGVRPYRVFIYLLVTADLQDAAKRVEALKKYKGINLYAQAERNERLGVTPNKMQMEFAQRYIYGGCYRTETWEEYCRRKRL